MHLEHLRPQENVGLSLNSISQANPIQAHLQTVKLSGRTYLEDIMMSDRGKAIVIHKSITAHIMEYKCFSGPAAKRLVQHNDESICNIASSQRNNSIHDNNPQSQAKFVS